MKTNWPALGFRCLLLAGAAVAVLPARAQVAQQTPTGAACTTGLDLGCRSRSARSANDRAHQRHRRTSLPDFAAGLPAPAGAGFCEYALEC